MKNFLIRMAVGLICIYSVTVFAEENDKHKLKVTMGAEYERFDINDKQGSINDDEISVFTSFLLPELGTFSLPGLGRTVTTQLTGFANATDPTVTKEDNEVEFNVELYLPVSEDPEEIYNPYIPVRQTFGLRGTLFDASDEDESYLINPFYRYQDDKNNEDAINHEFEFGYEKIMSSDDSLEGDSFYLDFQRKHLWTDIDFDSGAYLFLPNIYYTNFFSDDDLDDEILGGQMGVRAWKSHNDKGRFVLDALVGYESSLDDDAAYDNGKYFLLSLYFESFPNRTAEGGGLYGGGRGRSRRPRR